MRCNSPTSNYTRQTWKLSSVCAVLRVLRHPGWMDLPRRSKPVNMKSILPAGVRSHGLKDVQPARSRFPSIDERVPRHRCHFDETIGRMRDVMSTLYTSLEGWGGPDFWRFLQLIELICWEYCFVIVNWFVIGDFLCVLLACERTDCLRENWLFVRVVTCERTDFDLHLRELWFYFACDVAHVDFLSFQQSCKWNQ